MGGALTTNKRRPLRVQEKTPPSAGAGESLAAARVDFMVPRAKGWFRPGRCGNISRVGASEDFPGNPGRLLGRGGPRR